MILCIAEKPSQAADIAKVLGIAHTTDRSKGYFEADGYCVTWTIGHLCELKAPADYTNLWQTWSLAALPMIPARFGIRLKEEPHIRRQFAVIEKLMQQADRIVNCGDAGQEGELIQRWVMQKAGAKCPVERLWINSLTEEAIREGFAHLRPAEEYRSLYEAGLCRAIGDWLLGMNATRLYTLKYGNRPGRQGPLSIGRVQTPTLALIVNRQAEIDNFQPRPYWVLTTHYRDTLFTAEVAAEEAEEQSSQQAVRGFDTEEEGQAALERIQDAPFEVVAVQKKKGTEAPPHLPDLTTLQVECNKKFGYAADQTLQIIQSLYEKKVATYPRVDTRFLPNDVYPKCAAILNGIQEMYGDLLTPLRGKPLRKSRKVFDDSKITDHHAIIPTGVAPKALSEAEARVFDLVARSFIAVFYPDCQFSTTTVLGKAADVPFKRSGRVIVEPGWRFVMTGNEEKENAEGENPEGEPKENALLPDFKKGEQGPHTPELAQKTTRPPKPYTEATLLRAMETAGKTVDDEELREALKENGIGRPSTRAEIIKTLFNRGYICRKRKSLAPTDTGKELISLIRQPLLKSASLTGIWERKLRQIERRQYQATDFIAELKEMVSTLVQEVMAS
ncbi:MAG: DNA topoisomerase 3 [Alloprevotella sp.]